MDELMHYLPPGLASAPTPLNWIPVLLPWIIRGLQLLWVARILLAWGQATADGQNKGYPLTLSQHWNYLWHAGLVLASVEILGAISRLIRFVGGSSL